MERAAPALSCSVIHSTQLLDWRISAIVVVVAILLHVSFLVSSMGSRWPNEYTTVLEMLLSKYRRHYFCGGQCRHGTNARGAW
jgi:hypothetical protein